MAIECTSNNVGWPADAAHQLMAERIRNLEAENEKLRKALSQRLQEAKEFREIAERLEEGILLESGLHPSGDGA